MKRDIATMVTRAANFLGVPEITSMDELEVPSHPIGPAEVSDQELPENWSELLDSCDLPLAADVLHDMLNRAQAEASAQGGAYYWLPEFGAAAHGFVGDPSKSTAVRLLQLLPRYWEIFEGCLPGGIWATFRDLGNR